MPELKVVSNATCTFCGCVCDDIELHSDGERIVRARHDVDDAVLHERLRFARVLRAETGAAQVRAPDAFQRRDVAAIDLRQRRIAAVVPVAAVGRPAVGRRRDEVRALECRCAPSRLRVEPRRKHDERDQ